MLDNGDKALCAQIAAEVTKEMIKTHVKVCPYGRSILKFICISIGIAIGSGLTGGGIVLAVFEILKSKITG